MLNIMHFVLSSDRFSRNDCDLHKIPIPKRKKKDIFTAYGAASASRFLIYTAEKPRENTFLSSVQCVYAE